MRVLMILVVVGYLAGCGNRSTTEQVSEPPRPGEPRPVEKPAPADKSAPADAITIGELSDAYAEDAATAAKKYGKGVTVRFKVDDIQATPTGFMVTRTIDVNNETHRFYFPKSAASKLEGMKGKEMVARGKVDVSTSRGLVIRCE